MMAEIFDELSVIGDHMNEEDRVVYLLASLPESYSMLVTALEANSEVRKIEFVTDKLLHQERKSLGLVQENDGSAVVKQEKAYYSKKSMKSFECHHCGKEGQIKKNYHFLRNKPNDAKHSSSKVKANSASAESKYESDESVGQLAAHAMLVLGENMLDYAWIVDSGATCHMCNNKNCFVEYDERETISVALSDGHSLEAIDSGKVTLKMLLPDGKVKKCRLHYLMFCMYLNYLLIYLVCVKLQNLVMSLSFMVMSVEFLMLMII